MKKIAFYSSKKDLAMGSYRIWVHDLCGYLDRCGFPVWISENAVDLEAADVIICAKSDVASGAEFKKKYPSKAIGVINPVPEGLEQFDFAIVGSIEEMASLACVKNVFLFPLIENLYQGQPTKAHCPGKVLKIGFHGHYPHLNKFEPHIREALEELGNQQKVELLVVTGRGAKWVQGRPNIKVTMKDWNHKKIIKYLSGCDIGIVPNVTPLDIASMPTDVDLGLYDSDFAFRLKHKSNAGRCFVFHQLGIPVVADFTPSNLHIMGDPDCGFIANSKESWLKALLALRDHSVRQKVADNAKMEFDRLYDPLKWAKSLYGNISKI